MKGFPKTKNCIDMDNIKKCSFTFDENKNIAIMKNKTLTELIEDEFMEPVQMRHNLKNKENRNRLVGHFKCFKLRLC